MLMEGINLNTVNPLTAQLDPLGQWRITFCIGMLLVLGLLFKRILTWKNPFHLLWAYSVLYATILLEFPLPFYGVWTSGFLSLTGMTILELLTVPFFVLHTSTDKILKVFKWLIWIDIVLVWFHISGLQLAPSFDTALIALYLPFAGPWLAWVSLLTILTHHGTTAYLMLLGYVLVISRRRWEYNIVFWVALPAIAGLAYLQQNSPWFDSSERLEHWARAVEFTLPSKFFVVCGVGPGSFTWSSGLMNNFIAPFFIDLHNDWLQIYFELGLVGLGLSLWGAVATFWRVRHSLMLCEAVVGLAIFMATYHPFRHFPSLILSLTIIKLASEPIKENGPKAVKL